MTGPPGLAIAFDLGTTTIAAALINRATGECLAMKGGLNPQREFGLDVVSRLDAAMKSEQTLAEMKRSVNGALERLALELLGCNGASLDCLKRVAIAGNPAMEHFLLGLPVRSLAFPPYRPLFNFGRTINSAQLGWETSVDVYLFPLPGGFVGGDLVAFLFGCDSSLLTSNSSRLFLDLGTNGEIAVVSGGRIFATAAAAGPAFEGGNLSCGMAALPGAIWDFRLEGEKARIEVVGGAPPQGICGSGVMAAVSELLRTGLIDPTGRLLSPSEIPSNLANRMMENGKEMQFVLHRDATKCIYLGQNDIRQVQLAKAAIRAGVEVLFERSGIAKDDVREVLITGSFGAVLDPGFLKNVGILPEKMVDISRFVRDGALAGVVKSVSSPEGMEEVEALAEEVRVIPLSGTPFFERHFLEQMNFPAVG